MAHPSRVPLTDIAATIAISPGQAAAIVWQVAARLDHWIRVKQPPDVIVPSLQDLALNRGGTVWWHRGRVLPRERTVDALGALLGALMDAGSRGRAPAGLVYVLARATDQRHLAPFDTLEEFRAAVGRHAGPRPAVAVDGLLAQFFMARAGLEPLGDRSTIADVRRLRRAGGVALPTIAADTGIPISLLRELEWGVYSNWTLAHARPSVEAYAARAGLDPAAVAAIVSREQQEQFALVPVETPRARPRDAVTAEVALPFGLAAAVLVMLALAAPGSQPQPRVTTAAHAAATVQLEPAAAIADVPPTIAEPAAVERAIDDRPPAAAKARPVVRPRPRARRDSAPAPRDAAPATRAATHSGMRSENGFVRFVQTIAGDGRYKVAPFPRPDHQITRSPDH